MFVKITMANGDLFISEFTKVRNLGRYFAKCLKGKPFNAWVVLARTHPVTGEPCIMRQRHLLNPAQIISMLETDPSGVGLVTPQRDARCGLYTVVDGDGTGLPVGTVVPRHRDPATLNFYIVTGMNAAGGEIRFEFPQPEVATMTLEESEGEDYDEDEDAF